MRMQDKTAVVIGVGSNIGRVTATRFAVEGAHVIVADSEQDAAESVAAAIRADGGLATPVTAPHGSDEGAAIVAERADSLWGKVDALVHCPALVDFWEWSSPEDNLENWDLVIRINLLGAVSHTRAHLPLLAKSVSGAIVYLGSIDGILGNPTIPAYSVSKAGLVVLTHVMAHTCGALGVRVNCLAVGGIQQDGSDSVVKRPPSKAELLVPMTPAGRRAVPDDFARAAMFLVSEDASYISGTVIPVDGGRIGITPPTGLTPAVQAAHLQQSTKFP